MLLYRSATLSLPIGTEQKEKRCGIIRAYQVEARSSVNRTLLSTLIVIQTNPIVQTQGDRLIKVGCIIDNNMHENGMIDDIALGSSLVITHRNPTNEGTLLLNTTGTAPRVSMRVIDLAERQQISDVSLGQNLELQINLDPADSLYDIRAVQLIAKSDTGYNSIMLLDKRGCPTDLTVFPQLEKRRSNSTHQLYGRFHAFKFAGSSYVNFEVIIQFCMRECAPVSCGPNIQSNGRRRRRRRSIDIDGLAPPAAEPELTVLSGQTVNQHRLSYDVFNEGAPDETVTSDPNQLHVIDTNDVISQRVLGGIAQEIIDAHVAEMSRGNFTRNQRVLKELAEIPLQFQFNVRVPAPTSAAGDSESLIYGENNHILVAGIGE